MVKRVYVATRVYKLYNDVYSSQWQVRSDFANMPKLLQGKVDIILKDNAAHDKNHWMEYTQGS